MNDDFMKFVKVNMIAIIIFLIAVLAFILIDLKSFKPEQLIAGAVAAILMIGLAVGFYKL